MNPVRILTTALIACVGLAATSYYLLGLARDRPVPATPQIPLTESESGLPVLFEIGPFELTDLEGQTRTRESLRGRPWIAMVFFSHCTAACPGMIQRMLQMQAITEGTDIRMVSFTLDPERDTPERLAEYARTVGADTSRWLFLRGEQAIRVANESLKLSAAWNDDRTDIDHSTKFLLVDSAGKVRGIYDSTDPQDLARLRDDLPKITSR